MMKPIAVVALAVVLLAASPPAVVEAGSFSIRSDADDTDSRPDIHYVMTRKFKTERLGRPSTSVQIESWGRFSHADINVQEGNFYVVRFDTRGDRRIDRWIYFYTSWPSDSGSTLWCDLRRPQGGHVGGGYHPDSTTEPTVVGCIARQAWLDIEHAVEFNVALFQAGHAVDRAPDHGRYRGLVSVEQP